MSEQTKETLTTNEALNELLFRHRALQDQYDQCLRDPLHTNRQSVLLKDLRNDLWIVEKDIFDLKIGVAAALSARRNRLKG